MGGVVGKTVKKGNKWSQRVKTFRKNMIEWEKYHLGPLGKEVEVSPKIKKIAMIGVLATTAALGAVGCSSEKTEQEPKKEEQITYVIMDKKGNRYEGKYEGEWSKDEVDYEIAEKILTDPQVVNILQGDTLTVRIRSSGENGSTVKYEYKLTHQQAYERLQSYEQLLLNYYLYGIPLIQLLGSYVIGFAMGYFFGGLQSIRKYRKSEFSVLS